MKFYRIDYIDHNEGWVVAWETSKHMAEYRTRSIRKMFKELPYDPPEINISIIDIPTTRKGLRGWLNVHMSRDNG